MNDGWTDCFRTNTETDGLEKQNMIRSNQIMAYLLLFAAIASEILASALLKYTDGFTRLYPSLGCIAVYGVCFFCFSKALRSLNLGVAYATWSAVGIVAAALISTFVFRERISIAGIAGICLIVAGCLLLNLFGVKHS